MHHQQTISWGTGTKTFHQLYLKGTAQATVPMHIQLEDRPVQTGTPTSNSEINHHPLRTQSFVSPIPSV